jgi:hypothetical protein
MNPRILFFVLTLLSILGMLWSLIDDNKRLFIFSLAMLIAASLALALYLFT